MLFALSLVCWLVGVVTDACACACLLCICFLFRGSGGRWGTGGWEDAGLTYDATSPASFRYHAALGLGGWSGGCSR